MNTDGRGYSAWSWRLTDLMVGRSRPTCIRVHPWLNRWLADATRRRTGSLGQHNNLAVMTLPARHCASRRTRVATAHCRRVGCIGFIKAGCIDFPK
jgi:hypothetical protein